MCDKIINLLYLLSKQASSNDLTCLFLKLRPLTWQNLLAIFLVLPNSKK